MKLFTKKLNPLPVVVALLLVGACFQSCKKNDGAALAPSRAVNITDNGADLAGLNPDTISTISKALIAYWPLISGATDYSGYGNNGIKYNTVPATDRTGVYGSALGFNGTSSFISIQDSTALQPVDGGFSFNSWVNVNQYKSRNSSTILSEKTGSTSGWQWLVTGSEDSVAGKLSFSYKGNPRTYRSNSTIALNGWHMVTTTYSKTSHKMNIYIDGTLDKTIANVVLPDSLFAGSTRLYIGRNDPDFGPGNYFSGVISDVRIYNRAIGAAEVQYLHDAPIASSTNLDGYWPLNHSTKANDLSGTDHTYFKSIYGNDYNCGKVYHVSAAADRFGNKIGAYSFNGEGSYISFVKHSTTFAGEGDQAISTTLNVWVKLTDYSSFGSTLVAFSSAGFGPPSASLAVSNAGTLDYTDPYGNDYPGIHTVSLHEWHMVTLVYFMDGTASAVKFYLDGVLDKTYDIVGDAPFLNINAFGSRMAAGTYMHGALSDIRIYQRNLSDTEIQQLYKALN